jgi:hypothetical protein
VEGETFGHMLLHADALEDILQTFEGSREELSLLNTFKAVNKQWLLSVRRFLRKHAGRRCMLELFRHDCINNPGGLRLPMHCRLSPYASVHGLTVSSAVDHAGVLERSVEAVLWDVCIEAEACCPYSIWEGGSLDCHCTWHDDECPCSWHFEEVLDNMYDPAFCLVKLRIKSVRLAVGSCFFTCVTDAMRTKFGEEEIENATNRGLCNKDSLLLACMHMGCEFNGQWLSVSILPVLHKLVKKGNESIVQFIERKL